MTATLPSPGGASSRCLASWAGPNWWRECSRSRTGWCTATARRLARREACPCSTCCLSCARRESWSVSPGPAGKLPAAWPELRLRRWRFLEVVLGAERVRVLGGLWLLGPLRPRDFGVTITTPSIVQEPGLEPARRLIGRIQLRRQPPHVKADVGAEADSGYDPASVQKFEIVGSPYARCPDHCEIARKNQCPVVVALSFTSQPSDAPTQR